MVYGVRAGRKSQSPGARAVVSPVPVRVARRPVEEGEEFVKSLAVVIEVGVSWAGLEGVDTGW